MSLLQFIKKNDRLRFAIIITIAWMISFGPLKQMTYTGWDTHDIGFVNFLYFGDSLKNGIVPLWNHFIQSGTAFVNFNNIGLFFPIQLSFVILSWLINPIYAYELLIQFNVIIGGLGCYLLFCSYRVDKQIALFGATAFAVFLTPIVGQISFVVSLSSLPWLIYICIIINRGHNINILSCVFWGTIGALYISYGYLWMNIVNIVIFCFFSLLMVTTQRTHPENNRKQKSRFNVFHLCIFLAMFALEYGCLIFPGYLNLLSQYSIFNGDYISPEPRLRSLGVLPNYAYHCIFDAFIGSIDLFIRRNSDLPPWSFGIGIIPGLIFFITPWKKPLREQIFWLLLFITAIMYSAGNGNIIGHFIAHIPIINANRWWVVGDFYASIVLLILTIPRMPLLRSMHDNQKALLCRILIVGGLFTGLLIYSHSPLKEYIELIIGCILIWLLSISKNKTLSKNIITSLILINVLAFPRPSYLLPTSKDMYAEKVAERKRNVVIETNHRHLDEVRNYIYNNEQWVLEKRPFSHGYNNLGNPFYWYLKNEIFLNRLVSLTQNIREEKRITNATYNSDNLFVKALMDDVLFDTNSPTIAPHDYHKLTLNPEFIGKINNLKIAPNTATMQVTTNDASYLIFNNVNAPDWQVYVNGTKNKIIRANRLFQGVFLSQAGDYEVVFKYRPMLTITLISVPYVILLCCLIVYVIKKKYK